MLYIFDADGTLRATKSGKPSPNKPDDQILLPNVRDKIAQEKAAGNAIAIVSNQGGVSCGYMTEWQAWRIMEQLNAMLFGAADDIRMCFYHQRGQYKKRYVDRAKPKPDMLLELLYDFNFPANRAVYVGNQYGDQLAAAAANVKFHWAHEFFEWPANYVTKTKVGYFPAEWMKKWETRKCLK